MLMRPLIEFCQNNLAAGTERVKERLERDANLDVVDYDCLGYCDLCASFPYALVNGGVVTGESLKDLLKKIEDEIERQEEELLAE
jgi:uncharacterized protein YuzB (UPF0349 family)